ncbi:MAG: GntR family transcriptional regulator [Candidatus Bipolaricaulota bacterium]|nr:GntR family transcriptional regulator [Candidatus Bipolaricaulota bacterium]MBS3792637.1 GntR family transcriptional regulator [Candidatus Bipolaricaulota bacterium]
MKEAKVNKESPVPLYYQVKENLKEKIESGVLEPNERLPSERDLENKHGISRMTARRALTELESEGYVYREQGKGSYVAEPKLRQALSKLTSFTEDMQDRGLEPGAEVLNKELITVEDQLSDKLMLQSGEKVFLLRRVRLADNEPLAIETSHLRNKFCPGIEEFDFKDRSLYETLKREFGINLGRAEQSVEANLASKFKADVLNVEKGSPMLTTERLTFLTDGETPIELARSTYRGDRYKMLVELRR